MKKTYLFLVVIFCIVIACNNENDSQQQNNDTIIEVLDNKSDTTVKTEVANHSEKPTELKQSLKLEIENIVFSFKTKKGKTMNIVMGKDESYMAYRFGTKDEVELQFPEKLENTFEQFTYSYYFRGGGAVNMGLDLNYLSFKGETHQFVVFDEWSAAESDEEEGSTSVGIKIIDLSTKKEIIIEGISSTKKGSLVDFRFNGLVKVEEGEM